MKISLFLLLVFFSSLNFAADQCLMPKDFNSSDLRKEMGPVRNQGSMGWCFGFVSADLMTHYLYKSGQIKEVTGETLISATSVSANYNRKFLVDFDPLKEVLKIEADKEAKAKKEAQSKNFFGRLNPFSNQSPAKPTPAPTTAPVLEARKNPTAADLKPWNEFSYDRQYTKDFYISKEAHEKIMQLMKQGGRYWEARELYLNSLRNLKSNDLNKLGISNYPSGGHVYAAILNSKNQLCQESEVRSGDVGIRRFDLKKMLDSIFDMARTNSISCNQLQSIQNMFPVLSTREILAILEHEEKARAYEILVQNSCKNKLSLKTDGPKIFGWSLADNALGNIGEAADAQLTMVKRIDDILSKGTPVAVNYNSAFLITEKADRVAGHVSSLVGKVFNPATCKEEYIMRNSYGSGCAYYQKTDPQYQSCMSSANLEKNDLKKNNLKSQCDRNKKITYYNPKIRCEEGTGYLFIQKDEMAKYLVGITYLGE